MRVIDGFSARTSPPAVVTVEDRTTAKTKGVLEFFMNRAQQAGTSLKRLAGRVTHTIVRHKKAVLITTAIALLALGLGLSPTAIVILPLAFLIEYGIYLKISKAVSDHPHMFRV